MPDAGRVKVQKLLYYCQGWHLATAGEALFEEPIEAWDLGPVVPAVFRADKYRAVAGDVRELDGAALNTVQWVVTRYGALRAKELIALTHAESPWKDVRARGDASGWAAISHDALRAWFSESIDDQLLVESDEADRSDDPRFVGDESDDLRARLDVLTA